MPKQQIARYKRDDYHLERQRRALRKRLFRMIKALDGEKVDQRAYSPFPYGVLEKAIEGSLRSLEVQTQRLVAAVGAMIRSKSRKD